MGLWYQRLGDYKKGFTYVSVDFKKDNAIPITDVKIIEYIKSLKIPPAYSNVVINSNRNTKVLAYGYDSKNRKQVIYHPSFIKRQAEKKFQRILRLEEMMPVFLKRIKRDLRFYDNDSKEKGLAVIITLIINCGFRVGNEKYAKENKSYGLTTLECHHIIPSKDNSNSTLKIKFIGKKKVENCSDTNDKYVIEYLKKQIKGKKKTARVFKNISSSDVNEYIKTINPEITSKDLRTWNANRLFLSFIQSPEVLKSKNPIKSAIEMVAHELHNTPAVCKSSYLHPDMITYTEELVKKEQK